MQILSSLPDSQTLLTVYNLSPGFYVERVEANIFYVSSFQGELVLKIFPVGTSLDAQRYQHWLLLALENQKLSFDMPVPIRDSRGATFYSADNGATWVLAPRIFGAGMQPNDPDQAYETGSALAELHQALATIHPLNNPDFPDYHIQMRVLPYIQRAAPAQPTELGLQSTPESQYRLTRLLALIQQFRKEPPMPDQALHWHIIHSDFSDSNLRYDGERVIGVLDFESAHPDYRVREFTDVLMRVTNDLGPMFWGTARAFVDGYNQHLALTRAEIELVPRFIIEAQVETILTYCHSRQTVHAAQALRAQEETSAWLEVEQPRLLAMLRGIFLGE